MFKGFRHSQTSGENRPVDVMSVWVLFYDQRTVSDGSRIHGLVFVAVENVVGLTIEQV